MVKTFGTILIHAFLSFMPFLVFVTCVLCVCNMWGIVGVVSQTQNYITLLPIFLLPHMWGRGEQKRKKENSCWLCQHWKAYFLFGFLYTPISLSLFFLIFGCTFFYFALSHFDLLFWKTIKYFFISCKGKTLLEGCSCTIVCGVRPTQRLLL